jgi:hypothetical protein
MAPRARRGGSAHGRPGDGEPGWWEWLEQRPVGQVGVGVVLIGWIVLAALTFTGFWPLEVAFSLAIAVLTSVLGALAVYAAVSQARSPQSAVLRPPGWIGDVEGYFRWLTPVGLFLGLVFGHYFWH